MPLKPAAVTNYSKLMYYGLRSSLVNDVIVGQDDWLFYAPKTESCDTIGAYLDTFKYERTESIDRIIEIKEYCEARNIEFYAMLCPNKEEIYNQYLPSYIANIERESAADRAALKLQENGVNVIYPYEELKSRRDEALLYMKQDTHWTGKGAYLAYRQFYQAYFGETLPDINEVDFDEIYLQQDLAEMIHIDSFNIDYKAVYKPEISYTKSGKYSTNDCSMVTHSTSPSKKRLVLFGDSFSEANLDLFAKDFTDARFVRTRKLDTNIIDIDKPDVVIVEFVERAINGIN